MIGTDTQIDIQITRIKLAYVYMYHISRFPIGYNKTIRRL